MPITPEEALKLTSEEETLIKKLQLEFDGFLRSSYYGQPVISTKLQPITNENIRLMRIFSVIGSAYLEYGWIVEFDPNTNEVTFKPSYGLGEPRSLNSISS